MYCNAFVIRLRINYCTSLYQLLSECGRAFYDVVFLLDSSQSISKANFNNMLAFLSDLISYMDIDSGAVRVGLVTFGYSANVQFYLNGYQTKEEVLQAVQMVTYRPGGSNTSHAIRLMHEMVFTESYGDRLGIPNIAVLLTDGTSDNTEKTISAAARAKMDGIHIFGLGVTLTDITEMDAVVSQPVLENSFQAESFDELEQIRDILFIQICSCKYCSVCK